MSTLTKPLARYNHYRTCGSLMFIAGQGCRDPKTNDYAGITRDPQSKKVKDYDIKAQAAGVLANIERVLAEKNMTRAHLVDVTIFLVSMEDFPQMNEVWNAFFEDVPVPPTRTTVSVKALPGDNFVEMKAIASLEPPTKLER